MQIILYDLAVGTQVLLAILQFPIYKEYWKFSISLFQLEIPNDVEQWSCVSDQFSEQILPLTYSSGIVTSYVPQK
jgi:hypothetical protein